MHFDLKKLGNVLLVLGVLAWVPFLFLIAVGQEPPIYPFLAVHLIGVIGGSRLRARYNPAMAEKKPKRVVIGRIMILLGVLAWAPYLYQSDVLGRAIEIRPFLALHLTGVLGGIILILSITLARFYSQSRFKTLT
jgi:hypothetical protein